MKRIIFLSVAVFLLFTSTVWATGSCKVTNQENMNVLNSFQRKVVTLTCTGDGTIGAFTFTPASYGIQGWYLYNVTTVPSGVSAPTNGYGITLLDGTEDIAGGSLASRSSTLTQTVLIAPTTQGYHLADGSIVITFSGETASPSIIVMTLRFTAN
jgi:hypothetical protein